MKDDNASTFQNFVHESLTSEELTVYNAFQQRSALNSENPIVTNLLHRGYLRHTSNSTTVSVTSPWQRAQAIIDNNPVLQRSPGDLRSARVDISTYLADFSDDDAELYKDYYEDEI